MTNYVDHGPQNSRGFRALKVWLTLRQVGRAGYLKMIADDCALSRRLYQRVDALEALEALTQNLSIATFRYVPPDLRVELPDPAVESYLDELNQDLLTAVEQSGELFLSNAIAAGKFALRACIVNFRTSHADVDAVAEMIARLGARIDRAIRPERF